MPIKHLDAREGKITTEWRSWSSMQTRCYNESCESYARYGGRGIKVCERWLDKEFGYSNFLEDMGRKPSAAHSLDRIDNDKGYSPSNCRWATRKQQANNRSSNRLLEIEGVCKSVSQWADTTGVPRKVIQDRLRRDWDVKKAVTTPKRGNALISLGSYFGFWKVLSEALKGHKRHYNCVCRCGNKSVVSSYDLRSGKSTKCKECSFKKEELVEHRKTHGKVCGKCKVTKSLSFYYARKESKDGKGTYCKSCIRENRRRKRNSSPSM